MRASSCSFSVFGRACELEPEGSDGDMSSAAACSSCKEPQFQETSTPHDQKCNANVQLVMPCLAVCICKKGSEQHIVSLGQVGRDTSVFLCNCAQSSMMQYLRSKRADALSDNIHAIV